jgi:transglutaminase-like putative cysteine protease
MRYEISHTTIYTYDRSVLLHPHVLRLRPRSDSWQNLQAFSLAIDPEPVGISHISDLDGNNLVQFWFTETTQTLKVRVTSEIETFQTNPFNYQLQPWATRVPIDYPSSLKTRLQPYFQTHNPTSDAVALELAQDIHHQVGGQTLAFLSTLNQWIYANCEHTIREEGEPWPAGVTWRQKRGSCRDFVVLFMEVCRAIGLAARFVSGYQEGDLDSEERHLHAWAEVYLPGAGWRGYDPTHGLAVADRHVSLVASTHPQDTAPLTGAFTPASAQSLMENHISISLF